MLDLWLRPYISTRALWDRGRPAQPSDAPASLMRATASSSFALLGPRAMEVQYSHRGRARRLKRLLFAGDTRAGTSRGKEAARSHS